MLELDGIIRKDVIRFLHDSYPLTEILYKGFNNELAQSVKDAKKRIFAGALRYPDMANQREYIVYHQQKLVELAGRLADHATNNRLPMRTKRTDSKALLHSLYEALDDLLDFMNTFFADALPPDHWLSVDYYYLVAHEVNEGFDELQVNFRALSISKELVDITLAPLIKFINKPTDNDLTYRRKTFIKKLKFELIRLYELRRNTIVDKDVHHILFTLNFNSIAYLNYVGVAIRRRIEHLSTAAKKIDVLREILRDVSQTVQFPDVIFDTQNPQLKAYTMDWLRQEIQFWESVHELPTPSAPAADAPSAQQNPHLVYKGVRQQKPGRLKTKFNLSVKQISFLLRVFDETEVMEDVDMKELIRDLAAIFRSKQREFVSATSLYKKMSEVDTATAVSIYKLFLKLAKHVETVYGVRG
ncbi:hypothetical protein [Parachryseolinea silvisoli]|uniref:hypothetical protein n=1 Tax=Parachryseolinea silvisoli TaxID=2873601 RepID=UPI002265D1B5|nr:hypothetical protein [Parachryseolinea silvisoli]MCD9015216.1 hypothetical protein [Parachryseolinea silvisoli]